jgi:molybdate transport system regulatory protein
MKTSARNQFRGKVKTLRSGAVDDLQLQVGREAVALIKASFVLLSPELDIRISARNRLAGLVSKVIPGSVNCEIKVQLAGGRTLTAIVTNEGWKELQLAEGSPCVALIKASHVLLAVTD